MTDRRWRSRAQFEGLTEAYGLIAWHLLNFHLPRTWTWPFSREWRAFKKLDRVGKYVYEQLLKEGWYV